MNYEASLRRECSGDDSAAVATDLTLERPLKSTELEALAQTIGAEYRIFGVKIFIHGDCGRIVGAVGENTLSCNVNDLNQITDYLKSLEV